MVRSQLERKLRYQHVYDLVLAIMAERDLKPGDRLPSTTALAGIAEVSTISVRRALDELERAGKITRRQGLGTFVAESRIAGDPNRPRELLQTLLDRDGHAPTVSTSLISISVGVPNAAIATALGVESGHPVWEIRRSIGDADTILIAPCCHCAGCPPSTAGSCRRVGSLHRFIEERYGLECDYTEQSFELTTPSVWEVPSPRTGRWPRCPRNDVDLPSRWVCQRS
jgi:GntR family transcriptional regulator